MAGTTTLYGFPYPGPDDPDNVPGDIQALAEAIEATISGLITDTGDQSNLSVTPGANWAVSSAAYRVLLGKLMLVTFNVTYSGADITAGAAGDTHPGNMADTTMLTVQDTAKRPTTNQIAEAKATFTGGTAQLNTAGVLQIVDMHTSSKISSGDNVLTSFCYGLP